MQSRSVATVNPASTLEEVLIEGNLARLTPQQRLDYYRKVCESAGLNPLTRPFDYLTLNGKLVLYCNRGGTDQLRLVHGVSVTSLTPNLVGDVYVVTATGATQSGRIDSATGAVAITGLKGEALANAYMKAETKAKRRLTLSLSGLGFLDESEVASIPTAQRTDVDRETGEVLRPRPVNAPQAVVAPQGVSDADVAALHQQFGERKPADAPWEPDELGSIAPSGGMTTAEFLSACEREGIPREAIAAEAKAMWGTGIVKGLDDRQRFELFQSLAKVPA